MSFCRAALIERLINEPDHDTGDSTEAIPVIEEIAPRRGVWNDISTCIKDNLSEVLSKLDQIESQIWGKLIAMERNYRTAKAYLRSQTITIDGTRDEFDGARIGLANFSNHRRDSRVEMVLKAFDKGIKVQVDEVGNVFMKKETEQRISVKCLNSPEIWLDEEYKKVFDIRSFKESLMSEAESECPVREKMHNMSMIFIKVHDSSKETPSDYLRCPLWLIIVHLISIDLTQVVLEEAAKKKESCKFTALKKMNSDISSLSSPSGTSSTSNLRYSSYRETAGSGEDSSASSSSYLPSPCSSKPIKSGVARRIMQHQQLLNAQNSIGLPMSPSEHTATPLAFQCQSKGNLSSLYAIPDLQNKSRHAPLRPNKKRSHSHGRLMPASKYSNGYSLFNLCDIDQLQNPIYFPSPEDAERRRRHRSRNIAIIPHDPGVLPFSQIPHRTSKKLNRADNPARDQKPNKRSISTSRLEYKRLGEDI